VRKTMYFDLSWEWQNGVNISSPLFLSGGSCTRGKNCKGEVQEDAIHCTWKVRYYFRFYTIGEEMKKVSAFLERLGQLVEAVDKEISEYWRNFFADKEEEG